MPSVPVLNVPDVSLPQAGIPDVNLPANPGIDVPGKIDIPDVSQSAGSLSIPQDVPSAPSLKDVNTSEYTSKISEQTSGYTDDVKKISEMKPGNIGDVSENIEGKAMNLDEVDGLKTQFDAADKMKRYYDPDVAKEEALSKAKLAAVNHFAGHEEELKAAMQKLSDLKTKFPHKDGVLDLFAKRQRLLLGKPFIEHFIPGLVLQFQKRQSFWVDVNPLLGYRISGRLTGGLGWNQRLAYNFDEHTWDNQNRMYGIRSFADFKLKGKLSARGEAERMNAFVPVSALDRSVGDRQWVWSFFAGLKTEFSFSEKVKGNTQVMYSLYNPDHRNIYTDRINIRLGMQIPLRKKEQPKQD